MKEKRKTKNRILFSIWEKLENKRILYLVVFQENMCFCILWNFILVEILKEFFHVIGVWSNGLFQNHKKFTEKYYVQYLFWSRKGSTYLHSGLLDETCSLSPKCRSNNSIIFTEETNTKTWQSALLLGITVQWSQVNNCS
jgi:hypothetical protein